MKEASKCRRKKLIISHLRNQKLSIWPKSHDLDLTMWWFGHVPFLTLFKCKLPKYYTDQQCVWCFLKNIRYSQFWLLGRPDFFAPTFPLFFKHPSCRKWLLGSMYLLDGNSQLPSFCPLIDIILFLKMAVSGSKGKPPRYWTSAVRQCLQVHIELVLIPCVGVPEKCR